MTCGCNECADCQEEYTGKVSIQGECGCGTCNDCAPKKECCVPNIVGGNCIEVSEDGNGIITISTECNPEVLSSDGSVTVTKTHDDIDHWDLSVNDSDRKVGACDSDKTPGTLDEKLVGVNGITITPICSDNGKIQIGFDHSTINCEDKKVAVAEGCSPDYLGNLISVNSKYIQGNVSGCRYVISDKEPPMYYAKVYLSSQVTKSLPKGSVLWYTFDNGQANISNIPGSGSVLSREYAGFGTDYVQGLQVVNGIIKITKKGLYNIGFTGSLECGYGVHGIRVQLYVNHGNNSRTIVESRYSAPVGLQPYEHPSIGPINATDNNTVWNNSTYTNNQNTTNYSIKVDNPIITEKTDVQGVSGKSASLGAYISRMPVGGYTIMELDVGDIIFMGAKLQTEIDYDGDILGKFHVSTGTFSLLSRNDNDVNSGGEAGLSISAHLVYPLV